MAFFKSQALDHLLQEAIWEVSGTCSKELNLFLFIQRLKIPALKRLLLFLIFKTKVL